MGGGKENGVGRRTEEEERKEKENGGKGERRGRERRQQLWVTRGGVGVNQGSGCLVGKVCYWILQSQIKRQLRQGSRHLNFTKVLVCTTSRTMKKKKGFYVFAISV